jgi:hypothetical protein
MITSRRSNIAQQPCMACLRPSPTRFYLSEGIVVDLCDACVLMLSAEVDRAVDKLVDADARDAVEGEAVGFNEVRPTNRDDAREALGELVRAGYVDELVDEIGVKRHRVSESGAMLPWDLDELASVLELGRVFERSVKKGVRVALRKPGPKHR